MSEIPAFNEPEEVGTTMPANDTQCQSTTYAPDGQSEHVPARQPERLAAPKSPTTGGAPFTPEARP